jgi:hypothetical protein
LFLNTVISDGVFLFVLYKITEIFIVAILYFFPE